MTLRTLYYNGTPIAFRVDNIICIKEGVQKRRKKLTGPITIEPLIDVPVCTIFFSDKEDSGFLVDGTIREVLEVLF